MTTTIHLTTEGVMSQLRIIVSQLGPKYVYSLNSAHPNDPSCRYVYEGKISCLVGRILYDLGAPMDWFQEGPVDTLLTGWKAQGWATWEDGVRELLQRVQGAQDSKHPYGAVQLVAEAYLAGRREGKTAAETKIDS